MTDGDFKFRPPERREAKRFEPPPWEQDAFEEMAKRREDDDAAEQIVLPPPATGPADIEDVDYAPGGAPVQQEDGDWGDVPVQWTGEEAPASGGSGDGGLDAAAPAVPEAQMLEMMAALRAEEPRAEETYSKAALVMSGVTGVIGVVMMIWSMAMLVSVSARGTGRVGLLGGLIVGVFGALFIGTAMWVGVRTLRQRGAL